LSSLLCSRPRVGGIVVSLSFGEILWLWPEQDSGTLGCRSTSPARGHASLQSILLQRECPKRWLQSRAAAGHQPDKYVRTARAAPSPDIDNFKELFRAIVHTLTISKTICKHLYDAPYVNVSVDGSRYSRSRGKSPSMLRLSGRDCLKRAPCWQPPVSC
jgi:hypothetical protein